MSESISADRLAREIMRQMEEYTEEVKETTQEVAMNVCEEAESKQPKKQKRWAVCERMDKGNRQEWNYGAQQIPNIPPDPSVGKRTPVEAWRQKNR